MSKKVSLADEPKVSKNFCSRPADKKSIQESIDRFDKIIAGESSPDQNNISQRLFSSFFQARQLIDEKTLEKESRKKLVNNMIKSERYRSLESKLSSTSKKIDNDVKR
jgi:hypothetical protein